MKKALFFSSLVLVGGWIAGVFWFRAAALVHVLLLLSVLLYLRSLMLPARWPVTWNQNTRSSILH